MGDNILRPLASVKTDEEKTRDMTCRQAYLTWLGRTTIVREETLQAVSETRAKRGKTAFLGKPSVGEEVDGEAKKE